MSDAIAVKRLSDVEVLESASHQHEFNATKLHRALGFPSGDTSGDLTLTYYGEDGSVPVVDVTGYTLYDSRAGQPHRSAEYRLYYQSNEVSSRAHPGDLLVLFRPDRKSADLYALVARAGTYFERHLEGFLASRDLGQVKGFLLADPPRVSKDARQSIIEPLLFPHETITAVSTDHLVVREAVANGRLPKTKVMADAAVDVLGFSDPAGRSDEFLERVLETETVLFHEIEGRLGEAKVVAFKASDAAGFDEMLRIAMSHLQARKSRRGQSLQHHFAYLLEAAAIPFTPQCRTEESRPDFIVPGKEAYDDLDYPSERLRMVGLKSRIRERWPEYLPEAKRVREKYHFTVDEGLTVPLLQRMRSHDLFTFMPKGLIALYDAERRAMLGTVSELLAALRMVL